MSEEVRKTAEARLLDSETAWREEIAKHHKPHHPPFDPLNCVWCHRLQAFDRQKRRVPTILPSQVAIYESLYPAHRYESMPDKPLTDRILELPDGPLDDQIILQLYQVYGLEITPNQLKSLARSHQDITAAAKDAARYVHQGNFYQSGQFNEAMSRLRSAVEEGEKL